MLVCMIAATVAGGIGVLFRSLLWGLPDSDWTNPIIPLLTLLFAPIAAFLIRLAISRSREFDADAAGARISGKPLALASALQKIEGCVKMRPLGVNPILAHRYIVNPLRGEGMIELFDTHPSTKERVARLQAMAIHN